MTTKNNFLHHLERQEWNDITAYYSVREGWWRLIAIVSIVLLLIVSITAMYLLANNNHHVLIFESNNSGELHFIGVANKEIKLNHNVIVHSIFEFITALRSIPSDVSLRRHNITIVHSMLSKSIKDKIDTMILKHYHQVENKSVSIQVHSIVPVDKGVWHIQWRELSADKTMFYSANLAIKHIFVNDTNLLLLNPAGLVIVAVDINHDYHE